jgi:hypothetical protein
MNLKTGALLLLVGSMGLLGCDKMYPEQPVTDQCMRRAIFAQCMKLLPAGPKATHYNDWDEVVKQCDDTAYYQAKRMKEQVPVACRASP